MVLNLTDVFVSEGKTSEYEIKLDSNTILNGNEEYPIIFEKPVSMTIRNVAKGKAKLTGKGECLLTLRCDRCLQDVTQKHELLFEYDIYSPETEMSEEQKEEQFFMNGYKLDADELITNEILLMWPMKVLCRENCRGICPVCGRNRNDGDCGCDDFVPDPRMAKIKDIFNANKEV